VHLTEREFRATQPLGSEPEGVHAPYRRPQLKTQRPPRTVLHALVVLTRAETTLALVAPVVVGALLAWWELGGFDPVALGLAVAGLAMSAWGFAALRDYSDYRYSLRPGARPVAASLVCGFDLIGRSIIAPQTVRDIGCILLTIGGLCSLWLLLLSGWPVLFFSGMSFLLLWAVVLLPLKYGHHGWGLGEAGIFLGLGILPILGSYFAQAKTLTWLPVLTAIPFGLFTLLLYFNYNAVHYRRDWLIHKRTLTVNLGLSRAMDLSALLTIVAYVSLLLIVTLTSLPLTALLALAALPMGLRVFARLDRSHLTSDDCLLVYRTSVHAAVMAGALFAAALLLNKLM
jgi:1,4-dihydroxy-2-naphthoate octaprenyltransferase